MTCAKCLLCPLDVARHRQCGECTDEVEAVLVADEIACDCPFDRNRRPGLANRRDGLRRSRRLRASARSPLRLDSRTHESAPPRSGRARARTGKRSRATQSGARRARSPAGRVVLVFAEEGRLLPFFCAPQGSACSRRQSRSRVGASDREFRRGIDVGDRRSFWHRSSSLRCPTRRGDRRVLRARAVPRARGADTRPTRPAPLAPAS